ncbi:MAG: hypothetical protein KFF73_19055 [Cyclobacteriaceae bacterium]|nr:hypothetical protein [Cyclobacteriaceae bacterium]
MNFVRKIFFLIFTVSLAYAVLRYHVFGDVPWTHFPLFVFNKVVALSGFLLLIFSSILSLVKNGLKEDRDMIGFGSLVLIIIHVFISVILLGPEYFLKFYGPDGKYNLTGELSMLTGILGLAAMWMVNRYFSISGTLNRESIRGKQYKKLVSLAIIAGFFHTFIMGFKSWLTPDEWHGYFPPITLLAVFGFFAWMFFAIRKNKNVT